MDTANIMSILYHPLNRTSEVKRYGCTKLQEDETLAQHITDVSMTSYMIACELKRRGESVDIGILLEKCLLHDADESITGDIPRNTKYASSVAHEAFEVIASESVLKLAESVSQGENSIYDVWKTAKNGKEGLILKLVDMLCVVKKALTEVELFSNLHALKILIELTTHLQDLYVYLLDTVGDDNLFSSTDTNTYLADLVQSALFQVTEVLDDNKVYVDRYSLCDNVLGGRD